MSNIETVDARGLSCPQPAMMARQVLGKARTGTIEVLVDSDTARENVSRLAQNAGWSVTIEEQPEDSYRIVLKK